MKKWLIEKLVWSVINNVIKTLLEEKETSSKYDLYCARLMKLIEFIKSLIRSLEDRRIDDVEKDELKDKMKSIFR